MLYSPGVLSCCKSAGGIASLGLRDAQAPRNLESADDAARADRNSKCNGCTTARPQTSCQPSRRGRMRPAPYLPLIVLAIALAGPLCVLAQDGDSTAGDVDEGGDDSSSSTSVGANALNLVVVVVLVAASGLFSGLTLGLLGLDKIGLEIIMNGDEPRMAAFAKRIQPVRADGNLLLCTLLLGNVAVNALLSIVMANLTSGLIGFILATVIITIFGEIIPQAVCSRHALLIGSRVVPMVKVIILIFYPITKPMSMMLDKLLGDEIGTIHSRKELNELLKIHVQHGAIDVETGREVAGAMNYKEHTVREVMTPMKDCFMLSVSEKLNFKTLSVIFKSGFSRIPVFGKDHNDVIGLLFTKDLIFIDPDDETPLKNFVQIFGRAVTVVWPDYTLGDVLKVFKQGKSHLSLVRDVNDSGEGDPFYEVVGLITLEDIIEEILGDEIVDETDAFVDVQNQLPVQRREFDMSRLQLLNANADKAMLSTDEAKAVASHLIANVPQQFEGVNVSHVESIIAASPVVEVNKGDKHMGRAEPAPAEVLYRRGRTSTMCTLILTGKVVVLAGRDGFRSDAGPWTVLGADALVEDEGAYKPDFSAHAGSERLRCVRISKASFDTITSMSKQEEEVPPGLRLPAGTPRGGGGFDSVADGTIDGDANTPGVSTNGSGIGGRTRDIAKPTIPSNEGAGGHRPATLTARSSSGVAGGAGAGSGSEGGEATSADRITQSPSKPRRGLPSGASLKILQAATGGALVPSAAVLSPKPRNESSPSAGAAGAAGAAAAEEDCGVGVVSPAGSSCSTRVAGGGDGQSEGNNSGGKPEQGDGAPDDAV
ncbi:unnamed protein product [Scytosiphon promiscuus]